MISGLLTVSIIFNSAHGGGGGKRSAGGPASRSQSDPLCRSVPYTVGLSLE
ncbi:hypothetical protein GBAR_LOCUS20822 [Geodia barretti]|uniref:Uncharacterized protein n=1 Tax=Geodia barretti TaxID=519541 RepID=A0AA35X403_GEOBA|nr:hypothetical protein GBAR_LOCUS20822 [Geodia barretti]